MIKMVVKKEKFFVVCLVHLVPRFGWELNVDEQGRIASCDLCKVIWCAEILANLECTYELKNYVIVQCNLPVLSTLVGC